MSPEDAPVLTERHDAVTVVRLNRPERLNAVSLPLYRSMLEELDRIEAEPSIRAVVITGAGRAFCVGADLKAHGKGDLTAGERRSYVATGQRVHRRIQTLPQPVVAAVNGHAIGAGLELALSCDLIVVARKAKLRLPELALGTFVGGGTVYTLAARVGMAKAKELLLLAEFLHGEEAVDMRLANRAVPADEVLETSLAMAGELAKRAPIPVALAKRLLDGVRHLDADAAMELEASALLECMATQDWREGIVAFHEKREPKFVGE
ncbi:MAG: enoyl-CoA hydratase/isomerase family protein [Gemmatimonadota bacterium]